MTEDLFAGDVPATPPPPPKKAPKLYPIFSNARKATCRGATCGQIVYWDSRYTFPVSADCPDGKHPTATEDGVGVSHFSNCCDVADFTRRGKNVR